MGPYPASTVANTLLEIAAEGGGRLTPMQLQKLVYIAHGWHLAVYGRPLTSSRIEAWQYGPVIPSLYRDTRGYGAQPVETLIAPVAAALAGVRDVGAPTVPAEDEEAWALLRRVWTLYGSLDGVRLSALTHQRGTPWYAVWHDRGGSETGSEAIDDDLIERHYLQQAEVGE